MLVAAGARQIMSEFAAGGEPIGVMFSLQTAQGLRAFQLPIEAGRVRRVLTRDAPPRFHSSEHAQRVAWRIMRDWLRAQLAIVETEMVEFDQVMLPYMRTEGGATVYDRYLEGGIPALSEGGAATND
jgi:hypothetical protein